MSEAERLACAGPEPRATYAVWLWDHEAAGGDGDWSAALACAHLGGPNGGLGARDMVRAVRVLRGRGWSEVSMYVERENP